jgi:hypothetical protein
MCAVAAIAHGACMRLPERRQQTHPPVTQFSRQRSITIVRRPEWHPTGLVVE